MLVDQRREFVFIRIIFGWQYKFTLYFLAVGTLIGVGHELGHIKQLELPTLPLAVVGAALGIFVSFAPTPLTTAGGRAASSGVG
jgi:hypothetical protein